jgi:hypothetical protein
MAEIGLAYRRAAMETDFEGLIGAPALRAQLGAHDLTQRLPRPHPRHPPLVQGMGLDVFTD